MLGVVCLQTARPIEAVRLILKAAEITGWRIPEMRHNLGLALHDAQARNCTSYTRQPDCLPDVVATPGRRSIRQPLVSVIIPSYNHAAYISDCLRSVYRQTYRQIELIVIDDGWCNGTQAIIEELLNKLPSRAGLSPVEIEARMQPSMKVWGWRKASSSMCSTPMTGFRLIESIA